MYLFFSADDANIYINKQCTIVWMHEVNYKTNTGLFWRGVDFDHLFKKDKI